MMRILPKTIIMTIALSPLLTSQANAYCSKCIKIEADRAKEQAENPQPWRYYDDVVGLHSNQDSTNTDSSNTLKKNQEKETVALNESITPLSEKRDASSNSLSTAHSSPSSLIKKSSDERSLNSPEDQRPTNEAFFEEDNSLNSTSSSSNNPSPSSFPANLESRTREIPSKEMNSNQVSPSSSSLTSSQAYSTIYTIFKTKNFLETLDGPFTLFIPTNEAITQLPRETLAKLIRPEYAEKLAVLVSNHVVARKLLSKDFIENNNAEVKAISGRNLTLTYQEGKLFIDNIQILRSEPAGYDGIIYVIDKVLVP